ncbi:MAG: hypothetical protein HY722_08855 [Planctomycetes bacterium]|nr:hypothetical protein [Planctomycetota bacterium]
MYHLSAVGDRATLLHALSLATLLTVGCGASGGHSVAPPPSAAATSSATGASTSPTGAPAATPAAATPRTKTARVVARAGEGFLEEEGGRFIVHVKGLPYAMGLQYGELMAPEIEAVLGKIVSYAGQQFPQVPGFLIPVARPLVSAAVASAFRPYFTPDDLGWARGIVDGMRRRLPATRVTEDDLIFLNSLVDFGAVLDLASFKCSSFAAWGDLTRDGKVYQTRNVDLFVGTGLEEHPVVAVVKPEGGVPYINLGYAGLYGVVSGMNAHGLGMGQVWGFSNDRAFGRPWPLTVRDIMTTGVGYEDAIRAFGDEPHRTYGSNFVFADRGDGRLGAPGGCSVEVTRSHFASFLDDDPREDLAVWNGQPYGIRIPQAVFRGDCALDPVIRSLQTASKGPTGDPRTAGAYKDRYKGQADRILAFQAAGVLIGRDETREISQEVAMRKSSLQCCVYENSDLRVWVSNARMAPGGLVLQAYAEPYHPYDLDYYAPSLALLPDRTSVLGGERLRVDLRASNLGRARDLDVRVSLESDSGVYPTPYAHVPYAAHVAAGAAGGGAGALDLVLPTGLAPGPMRLRAEVYERGTGDLVDIVCATVNVR